ncbi:MAG TPA: anaerobic ribonucleoside-triphosphate reductase activating protein [Clostridia bacterium]|nr:anaerobic ribonucleoside-triphosphate reductase activating protein [Clostridia bacterium]
MKLAGLQKLSLLDYPGKVCCTVFTPGCNFRCSFCHNASLVQNPNDAPIISEEYFFSYIEKRKDMLDAVCITGGEPLLQPDIEPFLERIKSYGLLVKTDTNGSFPERLKSIVNKGLCDYVAMDVKSSEKGYLNVIGLSDFDYSSIDESIDFLKKGTVPYEFRTTVAKQLHTDEDFLSISERIKGAERYCLQNFVNSDNVIDKSLSPFSDEEMKRFASYFNGKVDEVIIR